MATLKITAKDGKTLKINVPEGTDPSQYDAIVDDVMQDYESQAAPSPETPKEPGFLERLGAAAKEIAPPTIPAPVSAAVAGEQALRKAFDVGGGEVAETLAGPGMTAKPALGLPGLPLLPTAAQPGEQAVKTSPEVAAGIGTLISRAPLLAEILAGGTGVLKGVKGIRTLGKRIGEAEAKVGIEQLAPSKRRAASALGLPETAEVSDVVNAVNTVKNQGGVLSGQVAKDINIFLKEGLKRADETTKALGFKAQKFVQEQLNKAVPGRKELAAPFGKVEKVRKTLEDILGGAKQTAGTAAKLGALGAGGGGAAFILSKILGR